MKIKKIVTCFVLITALSVFFNALLARAEETYERNSLMDFLKSTDDIKASYKYPSMETQEKAEEKVVQSSILPSHTPVTIRCDKTISTSEIVSGTKVNFSVVSDINDNNGKVLLKRGMPVTATITFKKDKERIGKSGQITIDDFHTSAVDGSYVPLSGSLSAKPEDKMVLSVVLSAVVCPLFLLMQGEDAQVRQELQKLFILYQIKIPGKYLIKHIVGNIGDNLGKCSCYLLRTFTEPTYKQYL